METFHRRALPSHLIALASPEGRALFAEALTAGGLEAYFPLAEQFQTQPEPAYCGLTSLTVALNSLGIDPGRAWKGPWRWFSEEMLDCCVGLDEVRSRGITIDELACLARCNGATAEVARADAHDVAALRSLVAGAGADDPRVLASYARGVLEQTGDGHFSPVAGYHAGRDLALVLDVARFKYPPHWVALADLHAAMRTIDPATGRSRGWIVLGRAAQAPAFAMRVRSDRLSWAAVADHVASGRAAIAAAAPSDLAGAAAAWLSGVRTLGAAIGFRELLDPALVAERDALKAELLASPAGALAARVAPPGVDPALAALLILAIPIPAGDAALRTELATLHAALSPALDEQVGLLAAQLAQVVTAASCC
jgi:glutathione gamma-glutamylcysteinyltransferase